MVCTTCCEGSTSGYAGIAVEWNRDPALLMDDESAISSTEELVKPGQALLELRGEDEMLLLRALPKCGKHPVEEQVCLWADLSDVQQFTEEGA